MMQIQVAIEPVAGNGYRARAGEPFCLTAEGKTQPEALNKLREMIDTRVKAGVWIVHIDIANLGSTPPHSSGMLDPTDPMVQQWLKDMEEYRKQRDAELDAL